MSGQHVIRRWPRRFALPVLAVASSWAVGATFLNANLLPNAVVATGELRLICAVLRRHHAQSGQFPTDLDVLVHEGLLSKVPLNPWGAPYGYTVGPGGAAVYSWGQDYREGGVGAAADLLVFEPFPE